MFADSHTRRTIRIFAVHCEREKVVVTYIPDFRSSPVYYALVKGAVLKGRDLLYPYSLPLLVRSTHLLDEYTRTAAWRKGNGRTFVRLKCSRRQLYIVYPIFSALRGVIRQFSYSIQAARNFFLSFLPG